MQVSPINNLNQKTQFKAKFKNTMGIQKLIDNSDKEILERLNYVIERAKKINDWQVFKVSFFSEAGYIGNERVNRFHYNLIQYPEYNEAKETTIDSYTFDYYKKDDKKILYSSLSKVLEKFVPTLEKLYPKKEVQYDSYIRDKVRKQLI